MSKVFFHNEHILVEGRKMSKSLNNFFTLNDIKQRGFYPLAFRLAVLQSHYRSQHNFTWDNLGAAQNLLKRFYATADLRFQSLDIPSQPKLYTLETVVENLKNDLKTPLAIAELNALFTKVEDLLVAREDLNLFSELLIQIDELFGLQLSTRQDISEEQKNLIRDRQVARERQDWMAADDLRNQLQQNGLTVRDTSAGPMWERV